MTREVPANVDWGSWLRRWDAQQASYQADREGRFKAMLDVLAVLLPTEFVALDLACGPGSISQRLLNRFPKARCIAVDLDPVLLAIGQGALGTTDGRLRWVEADLTQEDWVTRLGEPQVDAVLSTTALHWLPAEHLVRLYRQLGQLVRPGGLLLNGDHFRFPPHMGTFQCVAETIKERRREAFTAEGAESWEGWWEAVKADPAFATLLEERARRFAWRTGGWTAPIYDLHEAALRDAGFREVGIIWQHMDNRVLLAVR